MAEDDIQSTQSESGESSGATTTAPVKSPQKPRRKPRQLPRYKLLLHNDDKNTFDHVIRSIVRLTPINEQEATVRAIEAHESGVSLLLVTHLERAELYADQFRSVSVTTSIEPE